MLLVGIDEYAFKKKFPHVDYSNHRDQIIWAGLIADKAEVIHHYALMSVFVLPSQMDGFGLVLLEAMAMGVPVIGSNYGGIPDVIEHETTGFIFENEDKDQLTTQIQTLVNDKERREKFIANGFKSALHRFPIEKTVDQYEELFDRIADENHSSKY